MSTTLTTAAGTFTLPGYDDAADVPEWLRRLFQHLGDDILPGLASGGFTAGKLADRPASGKAGALYLITTDADAGVLYVGTGTGWQLVGQVQHLLRVLAANTGDVPLTVQGATGQTADLLRWLNGSGAVLARVSPRGVYLPPTAPLTTYTLDTAANGYRPTVITVKTADGVTTLSTATLTYDTTTGNLSRIVTVAEGRTVQRDLTYDGNGNLTTATESITAGA